MEELIHDGLRSNCYVENKVPWRLDVNFNEDDGRNRDWIVAEGLTPVLSFSIGPARRRDRFKPFT